MPIIHQDHPMKIPIWVAPCALGAQRLGCGTQAPWPTAFYGPWSPSATATAMKPMLTYLDRAAQGRSGHLHMTQRETAGPNRRDCPRLFTLVQRALQFPPSPDPRRGMAIPLLQWRRQSSPGSLRVGTRRTAVHAGATA